MTWRHRPRNWELPTVGAICVIVSLLHLFGFFELKWIVERVPTITLLVLGLFILLLTRFLDRGDDAKTEFAQVVDSVQGISQVVNENSVVMNNGLAELKELLATLSVSPLHSGMKIRHFKDVGEVYQYVASKVAGARHGVKDITWGSYTGYRTEHEEECYKKYLYTIDDVCKKGNIMYEEISSLSDEHYFRRSARLLGYYNYHLAYHDISCVKVPLISYVIVDAREVVIGFYRVPGVRRPLDRIVYLSVTNPMLVRFFGDYFEALWHGATILKESRTVNAAMIREIAVKLGVTWDGTGAKPTS